MFRRRTGNLDPEGPLVFDRSGRLVGVRSRAASPPDEPRQARRVRLRETLRRTRELEAQHDLRCTVALFCSDPRA